MGGFPTICYNEIHALTSTLMSEVIHNLLCGTHPFTPYPESLSLLMETGVGYDSVHYLM